MFDVQESEDELQASHLSHLHCEVYTTKPLLIDGQSIRSSTEFQEMDVS